MPNPDALKLDSYLIRKPKEMDSKTYECLDANGNKLFDIKCNSLFIDEYTFSDDTGKVIGIVHKNMLGLAPSLQLMDGSKNIIGVVASKGYTFAGDIRESHFALEDANGNIIALATGQPTQFNYVLAYPDGTKQIAKITKSAAETATGILQKIEALDVTKSLTIDITDNDFSRLIILQFVMAIIILMVGVRNPRNPGW